MEQEFKQDIEMIACGVGKYNAIIDEAYEIVETLTMHMESFFGSAWKSEAASAHETEFTEWKTDFIAIAHALNEMKDNINTSLQVMVEADFQAKLAIQKAFSATHDGGEDKSDSTSFSWEMD